MNSNSGCPIFRNSFASTSPAARTVAGSIGSPTSASKARKSKRMAAWWTRITSASVEAPASLRRSRVRWVIAAPRRMFPARSSGYCLVSTSAARPERICRAFLRANRTKTSARFLRGVTSLPSNAIWRWVRFLREWKGDMSLFPIFVKLKGRLVIVIGGGKIAEEKIPGVLSAGARIRLFAPSITPQIAEWVRFGKIDWLPKEFEPADLRGAFLVIAATSAPGVNAAVFREAEARGILCNAVDDIKNCHFYYGSIVQRGDLQIAISTNGKSPALAQRLRKELEEQFAPEYESWVQWLGAARDALRASGANSEATKKLLHELAGEHMFEEFLRQSRRHARQRGAA